MGHPPFLYVTVYYTSGILSSMEPVKWRQQEGTRATRPSLRLLVKSSLNKSHQIVLDLGDVTYIDSGGLGTLVGCTRRLARSVVISNLPASVVGQKRCFRLQS